MSENCERIFTKKNDACKQLVRIILFYHEVLNHYFCIPESFNTDISHRILTKKLTFVNLHYKIINWKGVFVLENWLEAFVLKNYGIQKKYDSDLVWVIQLISI